jgi:WhiB family redox-sensing transcriptional regulator
MDEAITRWLMKPSNEDLTTIGDLFGRPTWHRWAACRGRGTDAFIVGKGGDYRTAKELCALCVVRTECLEMALADVELVGLWGGSTEKERIAMRRNRGAA